MFGFESRMLEEVKDETGRRDITNERIEEELVSSLTFVEDIHFFYAQASINEREMIRFEGYKLESGLLRPYWEWKFTGAYIYDVEEKLALPKLEVDPVLMYKYLNKLEATVYEKLKRPQFSRNNRVKIRKAVYNPLSKMHIFTDTYHEITDKESFVSAVSIEKEEILESQIPSHLAREKEILEAKRLAEETKLLEQKRLGF